MALAALSQDAYLRDSRPRDEIRPGLRSLHGSRRARRGSHIIVYRVSESEYVDILRILHDSMDLDRHVPDDVPPGTR